MDWSPLLSAPWFIQAHALAAMLAFFLGIVQFTAPKGTLPHRTLGSIWVVAMAIVAVSSAFILAPPAEGKSLIDRMSWIHILTAVTTFGLIRGLIFIVQGGPNMKKHAKPFGAIFLFGLIIAGIFTFAPGRIMHEVFFG
ncbi:MAG: hypothetical protein HRU11_00425 [Parvularculaceae bacterium]|nr:hypothetical protein [Parvularculaceae bacterium]